MTNYWQYIESPTAGRRFAVGDIHGCNQTLQALILEQLQLTKNDQLFLLGDYVNRGPDSLGVLEFIIGLQDASYQVYPLRGNHEQMLVEKLTMRDRLSQDTCLIGYKSLARKINATQRNWLNKLPYYYELDHFYLVHGAINTTTENPLLDFSTMLWGRETHNPNYFLDGKQLIHGHTTYELAAINEAIENNNDCIPLDNGCYKACSEKTKLDGYGALCALDLDKKQLYVQENKDIES